jgi:hypothetical protein
LDLEITPQEAAVVMDALNYMMGFDQRYTKTLPPKPQFPYVFTPNPYVVYATDELQPRVYAVTEIFGIAFSQGVNEMQTLANLSSSRDVMKQVEINQLSLQRLTEFFKAYREALDFQLTRRAPEMIDAINTLQNPVPSTSGSFSNPAGQSINGQPPSLSTGGGAGSLNNNSPLGGGGGVSHQKSFLRRKSVRQSLVSPFGSEPNSEAVSQAVIQLKIKVLSFSDR